ncbi:MAG TPA: cyclophilin-like family protein [Nitrososphaeraceae archaeon]|nr:cyclophilin-like family protein [Nitrososphaeraceae archaeon]
MKKEIVVEFVESKRSISIELDNSQSSKTVKAILDNLPIKVNINRWNDELYTDKTVIIAEEENAQSEVSLLDVAYWQKEMHFVYSMVLLQ